MSEGAHSAGGRRPRQGATALVRGGPPGGASPRRQLEAAPPVAPVAAAPPPRRRPRPFTVAGLAGSTVLTLFVATIFLPGELPIAGVGLSPNTMLLIVCILPLAWRLVSDRTNRLTMLDLLIPLHVVWLELALIYNHGFERFVFATNQSISLLGGYLVGRVLVRNAEDYRRLFTVFFWGLVVFLPFALIEFATRQRILSQILDPVMMVPLQAGQAPRLGFIRVQGFLDHPILFGLFCSLGIANLYQIHRASFLRRTSRSGLAFLMTFLSLSSAPLIAAGLQIAGLAWNGLTRWLPGRWWVLTGLSGIALLMIQLVYPGGVVGLIIDNFAFDPATGESRVIIFEYGSAEVARNPIFGLGMNDWIRPWWKKGSVDNFFLLTAMRYGLPALFLLWLGLAVHTIRIAAARGLDETANAYRAGYLIAGAGAMFVLCTVHIWGATLGFIMFYIGAGSWFYTGEVAAAAPKPEWQPARRRPARP